MASTSSTTPPQWKYDVFLSFRGVDTRDGFISHLYEALCRNQIETFIDYRLSGGEEISPALLEKIEQSNISIVIFSENYAKSQWCLDELDKIHECKETLEQMVLPVFYKVDPNHVQELSYGSGDALAEHEKNSTIEKVNRWKRALTEIANLKGWDSNKIKPESKLIEQIVDDIWEKLNLISSSNFDGLVGIDSQINDIMSILCTGSSAVFAVGIWGMAGIGKTTIAEAVFNQISTKFEAHCFLPRIKEQLESCTLVGLRDKILSQVLEKENLNIGTLNVPARTKNMLQKKKVIIVLDDVSSPQQLIALVGEGGLLGPGSRIIVTSRDKQVLENRCAKIYEVKRLGRREALQLFNLHAFQQNQPSTEHVRLSKRVVDYAKGIPIVLKVLGCLLYRKGIKEWESELEKIEEGTLDEEVQRILEMSYDGLHRKEKSIFLDIACFFKTCLRDYTEYVLDLCGYSAKIGISRLNDRSLVDASDNEIRMHDLLKQLGQDTVYQECITDPGKRSRLWVPEDIYHVLGNSKGTETVETISLDLSKIKKVNLSPAAFEGMCNLRLLAFTNFVNEEIKIFLPQGLKFLPNTLKILCWAQYPLKSLPSIFCPEKLVELQLPGSDIEQVWDEFPPLVHLKMMNFRFCKNLIRLLNFSKVPNLEGLDLSYCESLVEVPSSIGCCRKLKNLRINYCKNLCSFPSCLRLASLQVLSLNGCPKIAEFPVLHQNIIELYLGRTAIETVPSSICDLSQLVILYMDSCTSLASLPSSIGQMESIKVLSFCDCSNLANLPNSICDLKSLEKLLLVRCPNVVRFPENLGNLKSLGVLMASHLSANGLPSSISEMSKLNYLALISCENLLLPPFTAGWWGCLTKLMLRDCGIAEIPESFSFLVSLRELDLSLNDFECIPESIKLSKLTVLLLNGCRRLQCLPELPSSLKYLDVSDCDSLKSVPRSTLTQVQNDYEVGSEIFNFGNCFGLNENHIIQIMDGARFRIQRLATFLFNQEYDMDYEYGDPVQAGFCVPGTRIPMWFRYRNIFPSLIVMWPRCSSQFLGCAFCVVVATEAIPYKLTHILCKCHLTTESGDGQDLWCSYSEDDLDSTDYRGKHVFVWYDSKFNSNNSFTVASFQFHAICRREGAVLFYEVIKCGVNLFFDDERNCNDDDDGETSLLRLLVNSPVDALDDDDDDDGETSLLRRLVNSPVDELHDDDDDEDGEASLLRLLINSPVDELDDDNDDD